MYGKANEIEQIKKAQLSRKKIFTKFLGTALAQSIHQVKMQRRQKFCKIKRVCVVVDRGLEFTQANKKPEPTTQA